MKSLRLNLLAVGCVFASVCSTAWASFPTLSYDTVTAGTISAAAQTNTYTFSANANDVLRFTVVSTSGSLWPCVQVATYPAGTPVTGGSACPGGGGVELNGVAIPSAGTYSISVRDYSNSSTGNYDIFLQRTDSPVGAVSLPLEEVQTGTIGSATQSNSYTFSANANDVFNLTVVTTSGSFWPCIQIYNSAGAPVSNGSACPGGTDVALTGFVAPSAGTYSVLLKDYSDTSIGNYNIFLQRTDGPPNPITLSYDTVTTGTISAATQTNNYTFAANANDILRFTVITTSGNLWPCIQVYNLAGTTVADGGACPGGGGVELNGVAIPSAGTYTISVKDYSNSSTGNYNIFLQRTDGPVGAVTLPLAEVQTGNIGSAAQSNAYTFSANANDVFNFTAVTTSSNLWPCLQIYNSAGAPASNGTACTGGGNIALNGFVAPFAGTYSLILKDYSDSSTGNYSLFLVRTNDPVNSANIDFDQTMTGAISAVTQANAYTFKGTAGDALNFTVVTTSGNLWPCMQVYNSAGAPVNNGGSCPGGGEATLDGFAVPSDGTYGVFIKDYSNSSLGSYSLSVQCSGTCLLPAPTLASISPTNVLAGSGGLTFTVTGSDFVNNESNSVVLWNGTDLVTTWVSLNELTAVVPAGDTATAGIFPITVFTPAPGGGTSNSINFTVNNPVPVLSSSSLSPASTTAGGATFTLTLNGSGFVNGSSVQWNTYSLATTYVSSTELTAQVPASDIETAGTASVTVFNSTPGGGTSSAQTFTIDNPVPVLTSTSLSPNNVTAEGAAFTLTVTGSKFVESSSVQWNGSSLNTTYVSATKLQAAVPSTDIATPGTASVTVFNPTPGGGTSSAITFTINKIAQTINFTPPSSPVVYGVSPITLSATGGASGNAVVFTIDASSTGTGMISGNVLTVTGAGTIVVDANQAGNSTYAAATQVQQAIVVQKAAATVALGSLSQTYTGSPLSATATTTPTGLTVTFTYSGSATAPTEVGSYTVVGTISNSDFQGSATGTLTISKASQTITFANPGTQTVGTPLTLSATASSGLAVTFLSATSSVCTVTGTTAKFIAAGTCQINAHQAGNSDYAEAPVVQQSFTVNPEAQTISFAKPGTQTVGKPLTLSAKASSGLAVAFTPTTTSVCMVSGTTATFIASGTCTIDANQGGNNSYAAAPLVEQSFTVNGEAQTITFTNPGKQTVGTPLTLSATASSGLAVTFLSATTSVCTVHLTTATFIAEGTCQINAHQAGNSDYAAAPLVSQSFTVNGEAQTITFANPGTQTVGTPLALSATASSGLAVTFLSATTSVCTVSGTTAKFIATGTCQINAHQAGNNIYAAATYVSQSFTVNVGAQTISFANPGTQTVGTPLTLSAKASSGLAVALTPTTTTICTVSGNTATFIASGKCTIDANQAGNSNYAAAPLVEQSFTVNGEAQTITFANPGTQTVGTPLTLSATASSGLAVTFLSATTNVCTVSGTTAKFIAAGNCQINAHQVGNSTYAAATLVSQSFTVVAD